MTRERQAGKSFKAGAELRKKIAPVSWPSAIPADDEEFIVTISSGNSHNNWTIHAGKNEDFQVKLCWRTPHLEQEEVKDASSPGSFLTRYMPEQVREMIYGVGKTVTQSNAEEAARGRPSHVFSVYFIATNLDQAELVAYCLDHLPCRQFLFTPDDFFKKGQGRYDTMGIDRVAALRAAGTLHGFPCLVIDGGTCHTYTAADSKGNIIGGGIGIGVYAKCTHVVSKISSTTITDQEIFDTVGDLIQNNAPLDLFARDSTSAIAINILNEMTQNCRSIIKEYVKKVGSAGYPAVPDSNKEEGYTVVITGGDGHVLAKLLDPGQSSYFPPDSTMPKIRVQQSRHLVNIGALFVILERSRTEPTSEVSALNRLLMGKRIAKEFDQPDSDGDKIYRGTIVRAVLQKGNPEFYLIRYDDGDGEELSGKEIAKALLLYHAKGEKQAGTPSEELTKVTTKKRNQSKDAAEKCKSALEKEIDKRKNQGVKTKPPVVANKKPQQLANDNNHQNNDNNNNNNNNSSSNNNNNNNKRASPAMSDIPAAKKAKTAVPETTSTTPKSNKGKSKTPEEFVGMRVAKYFGEDIFFGTIDRYSEEDGLWHVGYDDGDDEEFDRDDLFESVKCYRKEAELDPTPGGKQ